MSVTVPLGPASVDSLPGPVNIRFEYSRSLRSLSGIARSNKMTSVPPTKRYTKHFKVRLCFTQLPTGSSDVGGAQQSCCFFFSSDCSNVHFFFKINQPKRRALHFSQRHISKDLNL